MNTVANSFDIPRRRPETLLARYKQAYERRALVPMRFIEANVLKVGPAERAEAPLRHDREVFEGPKSEPAGIQDVWKEQCGFIFGTGAIHGFIAEYNRRPERSPSWAARVLTKAVVESVLPGDSTTHRVARRWNGEVRFPDGSAFPERDYFTVGASTCGQIGLGFKPFYRSHELPHRFHMLGIHATTSGFIRGLPRVWRGLTLGAHKTYEKVTPSAILHPRDGVVEYTLDGDLYQHHGPLEVSVGPRMRVAVC